MMVLFLIIFSCVGSVVAGSLDDRREALLQNVHEEIFHIRVKRDPSVRFSSIIDVMEYMSDADPNEQQELFFQLQQSLNPVLKTVGLEGTSITAMYDRKNTPGSYATDLQNSAVVGARLGKHTNTDANILGVMLHELSHIKHHDVQARQSIGIVSGIVALFSICGMIAVSLTSKRESPAFWKALAASGFIGLVLNQYSVQFAQYQEKRADLFAAEHGFGLDLAEDLAAFRDENPGYMELQRNWLVRFMAKYFQNAHPEIDERIAYLKEYHAAHNVEKESPATS